MLRLSRLKLTKDQMMIKYQSAYDAYKKRLDEIDESFLAANPKYPWGYTCNEVPKLIDRDERAFALWEVQAFWWQRMMGGG